MTSTEQTNINTAYANVKEALDALLQVKDRDKYLTQIMMALYKMEDMLYQYATEHRRGA